MSCHVFVIWPVGQMYLDHTVLCKEFFSTLYISNDENSFEHPAVAKCNLEVSFARGNRDNEKKCRNGLR